MTSSFLFDVSALLVAVLKGEGVRSESRIHTFLVGTCWGQELEVGRDVMVAGA